MEFDDFLKRLESHRTFGVLPEQVRANTAMIDELEKRVDRNLKHADGPLATLQRSVEDIGTKVTNIEATVSSLAGDKGGDLEETKEKHSWIINNRRLLVEVLVAILAFLGIVLGNIFTQ